MHTRTAYGFTALLAWACLWPQGARARVGEAAVREGPRGGPCFTVGAREAGANVPEFVAVTVSDGPRPLWTMRMPPGRSFALDAAMCVPYGGRVAALPRSEAAPLQAGRVYFLHIDAKATGGRAPPASYEGRFCLLRQADGSNLVHQIAAGKREGKRLFGCLPP